MVAVCWTKATGATHDNNMKTTTAKTTPQTTRTTMKTTTTATVTTTTKKLCGVGTSTEHHSQGSPLVRNDACWILVGVSHASPKQPKNKLET